MSYDLRIGVKVEDTGGKIVQIAEPYLANPTYNLAAMFRACTGWDYKQGEYYKCVDVIGNIERGIRELAVNKKEYVCYEPSNGWGSVSGALATLESLRECIYTTAEETDLDLSHLYVAIDAVGYYSLHNGDKLLFADKPLKELPSAQPQRMRGRWSGPFCSKCGISKYNFVKILHTDDGPYGKWNFCPSCGADMRGGEQDDN